MSSPVDTPGGDRILDEIEEETDQRLSGIRVADVQPEEDDEPSSGFRGIDRKMVYYLAGGIFALVMIFAWMDTVERRNAVPEERPIEVRKPDDAAVPYARVQVEELEPGDTLAGAPDYPGLSAVGAGGDYTPVSSGEPAAPGAAPAPQSAEPAPSGPEKKSWAQMRREAIWASMNEDPTKALAAAGSAGASSRPSLAAGAEAEDEEAVEEDPMVRYMEQQALGQIAEMNGGQLPPELAAMAGNAGMAAPNAAASPRAGSGSRSARAGAAARGLVVPASTVITAQLVTGVNTDLPQVVTARVSRNVYDQTMKTVAIPQGSILLGKQAGVAQSGQKRIQVSWEQLRLPNGRVIDLPDLAMAERNGMAGVPAKVDRHLKESFQTALLVSTFAAGLQLSQPAGGLIPTPGQTGAGAVGQTAAALGGGLISKDIMVPPTLTVPPGIAFTILLPEDVVVPAR